jgi:hypothetical protein
MEGQMKANVSVAAFYVQCPHCDADVSSPSGSLMWAANEAAPKEIECDNCEKSVSKSRRNRIIGILDTCIKAVNKHQNRCGDHARSEQDITDRCVKTIARLTEVNNGK